MARPETPQPLTFFEAILPVASLIVLVAPTPLAGSG